MQAFQWREMSSEVLAARFASPLVSRPWNACMQATLAQTVCYSKNNFLHLPGCSILWDNFRLYTKYKHNNCCTGTRNCLAQLLKFTKDSVVFTWCSKYWISVKRSYLWSSSVIYYAVYTLYLLVLALSTLAHTFSYRSISCSLFIPLLLCTVPYQQLYVYKLHKLPRWALGVNVKKLYCLKKLK